MPCLRGMVLPALMVAGLVAGCSGSATRSSQGAPTLQPTGSTPLALLHDRPCLLSELTASRGDAWPAGTHTYLTELRLTNTGNTPCRLAGYPSIAITLSNGAPLPLAGPVYHFPLFDPTTGQPLAAMVTREAAASTPSAPVTMQPGRYALFFLLTHTGDSCYTMAHEYEGQYAQDSAWQISGMGAVGTLTLRPVPTMACPNTVMAVTPVSPPATTALGPSEFPTPDQSAHP